MLKILVFLLAACVTVAAQASTPEIEPNNTFANADASVLVVSGNAAISGAISTVGDVDIFRVQVATASVVRFEITDATRNDCDTSTPTIRLYNSVGAQLHSDNNSGMRNCSLLHASLAAGVHYISVEEAGNNAAIAAYTLLVNFVPAGVSEVEPNEVIATSSSTGVLPQFVTGAHPAIVDSDFFMVALTQTTSVRFEIIEGDTLETCESNGVDSRLTLYNSGGAVLVDDDDSGRGLCSAIDGRGSSPANAAAANLPAGIYYLQVRSSMAASGSGGLFNYRLIMQGPALTTTAATASVGGRAVSPFGRGIPNVTVTLTDANGSVRSTRTTSFGYFRFDGVETGQSYVLVAASKTDVFAPQVVIVTENATGLILQSLGPN